MVATGRYVGGHPVRGRSRSARDWGLGGVHRCVSGLEQLERMTVVDDIDEGYPTLAVTVRVASR